MAKKYAIIIGTRPEAIKMIPIYLEMCVRGLEVDIVSTGQHASMLEQIYVFFGILPSQKLDVMQPGQNLSGLTARLTEALQNCFSTKKYDLVLVQGDTTTAFVASLVAFYNLIPVAHIEAGLRTHNKFSPFPEEINRQLISRIADYHFAPTQRALEVLINEGVNKCYLVGNTVIDSLHICLNRIKSRADEYASKFRIVQNYDKLVLVTGHRRENFGKGFEEICTAIRLLSTRYPGVLFYYPVHLNPNVKDKVELMLGGVSNVYLDEPLPYDELIYLMNRSYLILTDSGGIQEEGPSLNVPILVMRDTTERPEGIEAGCSLLVGTAPENIIEAFTHLMNESSVYNKMVSSSNPYGDGRSSGKIVDILEQVLTVSITDI
jgi:UDP-N-acetylglucosamine 2-epimerase (non-hydrolysing)